MPAVQRLTDQNNGGGVLTSTPQSFVKVDGQLVAVVGAEGTDHSPSESDTHDAGAWHTTLGQSFCRIGSKAVIRTDDLDSCGHKRIGGATFCRVGGGGGAPGGGANDWDSGEWDDAEWQ